MHLRPIYISRTSDAFQSPQQDLTAILHIKKVAATQDNSSSAAVHTLTGCLASRWQQLQDAQQMLKPLQRRRGRAQNDPAMKGPTQDHQARAGLDFRLQSAAESLPSLAGSFSGWPHQYRSFETFGTPCQPGLDFTGRDFSGQNSEDVSSAAVKGAAESQPEEAAQPDSSQEVDEERQPQKAADSSKLSARTQQEPRGPPVSRPKSLSPQYRKMCINTPAWQNVWNPKLLLDSTHNHSVNCLVPRACVSPHTDEKLVSLTLRQDCQG